LFHIRGRSNFGAVFFCLSPIGDIGQVQFGAARCRFDSLQGVFGAARCRCAIYEKSKLQKLKNYCRAVQVVRFVANVDQLDHLGRSCSVCVCNPWVTLVQVVFGLWLDCHGSQIPGQVGAGLRVGGSILSSDLQVNRSVPIDLVSCQSFAEGSQLIRNYIAWFLGGIFLVFGRFCPGLLFNTSCIKFAKFNTKCITFIKFNTKCIKLSKRDTKCI
jgi:hypothetical protein